MKLANLYESIGKLDAFSASQGQAATTSAREDLAASIVRDLLDEYARLEAYEKKCSPPLLNEAEDDLALEVLRSIDQMFEAWVSDAEPAFERLKQRPDAWQTIPRLGELRNAVGGARVRLVGSPEEELEGVRELRRGQSVRYATVEEFRNELRAQRRD
jgi:hypothetical protein